MLNLQMLGLCLIKKCGAEPETLADMLRSISKQSGESVESVLEKKRKVGRISRKSV